MAGNSIYQEKPLMRLHDRSINIGWKLKDDVKETWSIYVRPCIINTDSLFTGCNVSVG